MRHYNSKHLSFFSSNCFYSRNCCEALFYLFSWEAYWGILQILFNLIFFFFPFWLEFEVSAFCRMYFSKGKYLVIEDNHGILYAASFTLVGRILWIGWIISLNFFLQTIDSDGSFPSHLLTLLVPGFFFSLSLQRKKNKNRIF